MKGIILAGGSGSRLYPMTKILNKHMIPVYNKPMIMYSLQTLINAGITEIMIVAGQGFAGDFLELLGSGEEFGVNLSYTVQEKAGGIAQALGLCKKFAGKESIAVILGDNIFDSYEKFNFKDFREGARVYLKEVSDPERFGVMKLDNNGRIIEIIEKPFNSSTNLAVTGLYLYDNRVFHYIECLKPSERGEFEISDVNNLYIRDGLMDYVVIKGFWSDAGTVESLYRASTHIRGQEKL